MLPAPLTADQQKAADDFLQFLLDPNENEFSIEGFSGCGKTYLTSYLIDLAYAQSDLLQVVMETNHEVEITLTALTHKAATAIKEATGMEATTIHSYLGLTVYDDYRSGKSRLRKTSNYEVHQNVVLFIDEASMADQQLLDMIRESTMKCKVVYILDPKQLLPVFSPDCPVETAVKNKAKLAQIVRQQAGSYIAQLGAQLRDTIDGAAFPDLTKQTANVSRLSGKDFQQAIDAAYKDPDYDPANTKILAWSNNRVNQYNNYVRSLFYSDKLYHPGENLITNTIIKKNERVIYPNECMVSVISAVEDEVEGVKGQRISVSSRYTMKGATGPQSLFVPYNWAEATRLIKAAKKAEDWFLFYQLKETFCDVRPSYASTVHKSQGSTFDTVFIDLEDIGRNNKREEVARLLYVAITRARNNVYFYGDLPEKYQP